MVLLTEEGLSGNEETEADGGYFSNHSVTSDGTDAQVGATTVNVASAGTNTNGAFG